MVMDCVYTLADFTDFKSFYLYIPYSLPLMYQDSGHATDDRYQYQITSNDFCS